MSELSLRAGVTVINLPLPTCQECGDDARFATSLVVNGVLFYAFSCSFHVDLAHAAIGDLS